LKQTLPGIPHEFSLFTLDMKKEIYKEGKRGDCNNNEGNNNEGHVHKDTIYVESFSCKYEGPQ
jgi:hypothetical protein